MGDLKTMTEEAFAKIVATEVGVVEGLAQFWYTGMQAVATSLLERPRRSTASGSQPTRYGRTPRRRRLRKPGGPSVLNLLPRKRRRRDRFL